MDVTKLTLFEFPRFYAIPEAVQIILKTGSVNLPEDPLGVRVGYHCAHEFEQFVFAISSGEVVQDACELGI